MGERGALLGRKAGIVAGVLTLSAATFVATAVAAIEATARPDRPAVSTGGAHAEPVRVDPTDGATPEDEATPTEDGTPTDEATPTDDPSEEPTDDPSAEPTTDVGKPLCGPGSRCR
jgi:hypothetical protein